MTVYTYRGGAKLALEKTDSEFVVRATGEDVVPIGLGAGRQASTASTRLQVDPSELEAKMRVSRGIAPTHHAYREAETGADFLITDRVYVELYDGAKVDELAAEHGLLVTERLSGNEFVLQLSDATGINPVKLVVKLTEDDERVKLAENDLNYVVNVSQIISDGAYENQWHLHGRPPGSPQLNPDAACECEAAWEALGSFGSPNVVIGITDDGCRLDHHDFNSADKFAGWGYFEGNTLITRESLGADPEKMYQPGANHGTACAGVAAAELDGTLTVGAAPGCRLLPIKWPSSGTSLFIGDLRLRKAIDYVADKVNVLSNSWGNPLNGNVGAQVRNRIVDLAVNGGRRGRGIVFLWAAGNDNCPLHHDTDIDTPYTNGIRIVGNQAFWEGVKTARSFRHNLHDVPGVMYVAALASNGQRSHYSNYGTGIGITAPSSNSHTYWRLSVTGLPVTTVLGNEIDATRGNFGGTSSATPLVAGIAALVISADPDITAIDVISELKRTAFKDLDMTGYAQTPPASFDPDTAWDVSPITPFASSAFQDLQFPEGTWSPWFGHGRVNARAAVEAVRRHVEPVAVTNDEDVPIRDLTGQSSPIEVDLAGRVEDLEVEVHIDHTWIGDLRVHLIAPDGEAARLHSRTGAWRDDIDRTYTTGDTPALQNLIGVNAAGIWRLHVADLARFDTGKIDSWTLRAHVRT